MQAILAIAAATVVSGARSFTAIGEWAADAPQSVLAVLGTRWHPTRGVFVPPHEATLRRTIGAFDADLLDQVIGSWLSQRAGAADSAAIAVDGKTVRGADRVGPPMTPT